MTLLYTSEGFAQERVDLGTTVFADYYYNLSSVDEEMEGMNGFTYRRVYLTADFDLSRSFTSRVRFEAGCGDLGQVCPSTIHPFVKDLYLRWTSDGGHRLTFGITRPPVFDATEEVWLFRSLEKTVMNLFDVVDSRDFGIRADGPLLRDGVLRYNVMVGNNEGPRPENDKYKRVYGRLDFRPGDFLFTAGGDYAGYEAEPRTAVRFSGLAGYIGDRLQAGVEAFVSNSYSDVVDDASLSGASIFASAWFNREWGVVGRFDRVLYDMEPEEGENVFIAGIVYQPRRGVRFIPNVYARKADAANETNLTGRITLELQL